MKDIWVLLNVSQGYCLLARLEWSATKSSAELWTVFEVFSFQMQAEAKYISWTENSSASLDQACHWHSSLWKVILSVDSGLYKQISSCPQVVYYQCKLIFSEYGWPETLISDNGPCYTSPSP